jgi:U3 small nucleolar RNA-associated protein 14
MRELVFRGEVRAKRVARIKSRAYRRILGKLDVVDRDGDGEEERMRWEVERARERATLRHKNTGKWARGMKGREGVSRDERMAVEEMLERGERFRRKIQGRDGSDEEGEDDEEGDEDGKERDGIGRIKERAFEELGALDRPDEEGEASTERLGKGVFEMKFMKDAMARQQQKADCMVDDLVKELGGDSHGDGDGDPEQKQEEGQVVVQRVGGCVVFQPGTMVSFIIAWEGKFG